MISPKACKCTVGLVAVHLPVFSPGDSVSFDSSESSPITLDASQNTESWAMPPPFKVNMGFNSIFERSKLQFE